MKIGILYTGGTIGCVNTANGLSPLNARDFEIAFNNQVLPIIQNQYSDCTIGYMLFDPSGKTLDSTNLQPRDWCTMATEIINGYNSYDAFIVLHGTDTMAWTASALSFFMTGLDNGGNKIALLSKPVIVTGSQLPLFEQVDASESTAEMQKPGRGKKHGSHGSGHGSHGSGKPPHKSEIDPVDMKYILRFNTDALQNVCGAVTSCYQSVSEVCLYFDSTLMRGNRTVKTNASEFNAFSSPNYPNLGKYGIEFELKNKQVRPLPTIPSLALDDDTAYQALKSQQEYISANIDKTIVFPFPAFPAFYDDSSSPNTSAIANMLSAGIEQGVNGLILESYGGGNFPSGNPATPSDGAIYKVLQKAHGDGVVLVDCTQVTTGTVDSQAYASGSWLSQVGSIGSYDMTSIAALTKLIYLHVLAQYNNNNWSQSKIEELMITNLAGEIMDINVLDARGERFLMPGESIIALDVSAMLLNDPQKGPVLQQSDGTPIYAFPLQGEAQLPGQLHMQEDGNLVFYDRNNQGVYTTNSADIGTRSSQLILEGSYSSGNLKLYVQNYNGSAIDKVAIYDQSS